MVEIRRVGVLALAKFQSILMGIVTLIGGTLTIAFLLPLIAVIESTMGVASTGVSLGPAFLAIVFFAIINAIGGFITGAIGALLYNLVAFLVGGIKVDLKQEKEEVQQEIQQQSA